MLALFEVLSFKGWLDIRDVLIKTLGPVRFLSCFLFELFAKISIYPGSRHLHSHLRLFGLHDWFNAVCGCRYRQLL
jgi:hypothetical protein